MSYDEAASKHSAPNPPQDFQPRVGHSLSPAQQPAGGRLVLGTPLDHPEMDLDATPTPTPPTPRGGVSVNNAHARTPLPNSAPPPNAAQTAHRSERLERMALAGDALRAEIAGTRGIILNPHRSRYVSARVLAFVWQDGPDHTVARQLDGLGRVLRENYNYTFDIERIPSASQECQSPYRWMSKRLTDFVDDRDRRDVLKIVFYSGYTYQDANRDMVLALYTRPTHC